MSEAVDLQDLKRKSVRGGVVTMATQGLGIGIQLTSTVVLGRLLSPEDYGIMAMVMAVTAFAGLFRDLGLSAAAIQRQELSPAQQTNLFWLNTGVGALLTLALVVAAPWVAGFYGKPEVRSVAMLVAGNFLIGSLGTQGGVLLLRQMQFGKKAVAEIAGSVVGLAISILLALRGLSYWSLAWGGVASALVTTAALFLVSGFRPGLPQPGQRLEDMIRFGASFTVFDIINYFHRNLDNLLIGRFCGPEPLGLYSRAYSLLMLPINTLRNPILSVGFPAMSRLQYDPENFRAYYLRVVHLMALASMPLTAFLLVATRPVVDLVLGPKWDALCPIFAVLATVAFVQPMVTTWGMVVQSRGQGRRYVQMGICNTLVSVAGFGAGLPWGPLGVATGYSVATYVSAVPLLHWAYRGTAIRLEDFFREIAGPALASILAGFCAAAVIRILSDPTFLPAVRLAAGGAAFAPAYLLFLWVMPGGKTDLGTIWGFVSARWIAKSA